MNYQHRVVTEEMTEHELDGVSGGISSLQAIINQQEKLAQESRNQVKAAQDRYNAAKNAINKLIRLQSGVTYHI